MRNIFLGLLLLSSSCLVEGEKKEVSKKENFKSTKVFVDNPAFYSAPFLQELEAIDFYEKVELTDGQMIINEKDTILLPTIPKQNYERIFRGERDSLSVILTIRRVNRTAIEYQAEMADFGKWTYLGRGIVHLSPAFYLGTESDVDELTGASYFSTEYQEEKDSCLTSIRIGQPEDSKNSPYLIKLIKNCNGKIRDIDLENFPTLREK